MKNTLVAVLLSVGLFACAHGTMRGSVAMKITDQEAHVCMGQGEVALGDKVILFKNVCSRLKGEIGSCEKVKMGTGSVSEVLNEHYSVVKLDAGAKFEEGAFVEKAQ